MRLLITRLEQILHYWEDTVFLEVIGAKFEKRYNPKPPLETLGHVLPWQELRNDLLKLDPPAIDAKYSDAPWIYETFGSISGVPKELSEWTRNSRRVFYATHELQTLLALTSFEKITWGEIPWPFSSFVVALEEPIRGTMNGWDINIDTVLVSRHESPEGETVIAFRFLGDNLDRKKMLDWMDRDRLLRAFGKGPHRFANLRNGFIDVRNKVEIPISFVAAIWEESMRDAFIMDTLSGNACRNAGDHDREMRPMNADEKEEHGPTLDAAFRVVVGLCLYLTTIPAKSEHRSEWVPSPHSNSTAKKLALSNGAEICTISSIHRLSLEERGVAELAKRSFVEMSAHWRRGYWRRKPGEGNDPNALKVVLVHPTLVRKDRLQPGEVPAGTMTRV